MDPILFRTHDDVLHTFVVFSFELGRLGHTFFDAA